MSESQYRFAEFQLDCASFELRRQGRAQKSERVSLERIPMKLLILLLERQDSVVSRQEIVDRLWGKDVFVDTEHGINTAIRKIRQALRDDPDNPRFVHTVSGKGYRFVVEKNGHPPHATAVSPEAPHPMWGQSPQLSGGAEVSRRRPDARDTPHENLAGAHSPGVSSFRSSAIQALRWRHSLPIIAALLVLLAAFGALRGKLRGRQSDSHQVQMTKLTDKDTVVLADFANSTGDAVFDNTLKTALSIALHQSPFLNVLSENKVATTMRLMARPTNAIVTQEVAQEVCQRTGSNAYIAGSITALGNQYVLGLKAVNCQNGDTPAQEQAKTAAKEEVLDALGEAASKLRGELGESLVTVQKLDLPLSEATTSSLEALKAYSLGEKALREKGEIAALPYHQRAVELDPSFAMGYRAVAADYYGMAEVGRASEYFRKASQLRDHASEREKLQIAANYYQNVTGELDKAAQTLQEELQTYSREYRAHLDLGVLYAEQGQYEKSLELYREGLRLAPDDVAPYDDLANSLLAMQRFQEARQTTQQAQTRELSDSVLHAALYALAFLRRDFSTMTEHQQWFAGKPEEDFGLSLASDTEAYAGHLGKARDLTRRSVDSAIRADSKETGAIWQEIAAQREAAFGNFTNAKRAAKDGLKLAPRSLGVEVEAALAFAMSGDAARAKSLAQNLNQRFPQDTQMQSVWLPSITAQLALGQHDSALALKVLQTGAPIELGQIPFVANISCLYPIYFRGEAFLAAGQGYAAAAEFKKILEHSGIVWNCWTGTLAHLGVARANALESRTSQGADADAAHTRALAAYKDFFTLWNDADPDIPLLKQAKAEYTKLQMRGNR
jgi:eukaryotic-like serine/threonine-protein kinase